jgi:hypothetical protein
MIDLCGLRGERQEGDGTISLTLQHGMTVRAERVVSALPSNALAHCLRHHPTLEKVHPLPSPNNIIMMMSFLLCADSEAQDLLSIPFASLVLVHLAYTVPSSHPLALVMIIISRSAYDAWRRRGTNCVCLRLSAGAAAARGRGGLWLPRAGQGEAAHPRRPVQLVRLPPAGPARTAAPHFLVVAARSRLVRSTDTDTRTHTRTRTTAHTRTTRA